MRVELRLGGLISINGREIALGQTHALLDAIGRERSVRGAAERLSLSYRSTWGRVLALEEAMGSPVVVKTKGHGTVLTELGSALRGALGATLDAFEAALLQEGRELEIRLSALMTLAPRKTRLAASHDPLLAGVLADLDGIETAVVGSEEAVERLRTSRADLAGFHAGAIELAEAAPYNALLTDPSFAVRPLFTREQGLVLAPGNPLRIEAIEDVARTGARFVNRQKGAGTRLWFDRLLAAVGIDPSEIVGYGNEEFTHQAVAAVVASGAADVGMGVRAVAERFGLSFVPVGKETYFLAARAEGAAALDAIAARIGLRLREPVPGYALPDPTSGT